MSDTRTDVGSISASTPIPGEAVSPERASGEHNPSLAHWLDYARIAAVTAAIIVSRFHPLPTVGGFDPVGMAAALIGGYPIFREAIRDTLARRMTMELSMSIALIAALSIREVFTANVIIVFVLAAEIIEEMTMDRGHRAVEELIGGLPDTVEVLLTNGGSANEIAVVSTATLKSGDIVLVRPGTCAQAPAGSDDRRHRRDRRGDGQKLSLRSDPRRSSSR